MTAPIIAAVAVMVLINGFMFYTFRTVTQIINRQIRSYFLRQLDRYDDVVAEKLDHVAELREEVRMLEEQKENLETVETPKETVPAASAGISGSFTEIPAAKYRSSTFTQDYRRVRESFRDMDYEGIVREILAGIPKAKADGFDPRSITEKFTLETLFELSGLSSEDQLTLLSEVLTGEEREYLDAYCRDLEEEGNEFDILDFHGYLQLEGEAFNDTIQIKTNGEHKDLEKLDARIRVTESPEICEGIRVLYRGQMFDYSM